MSVLEALIDVILMLVATTLTGVTPALVTLDLQAMDTLAHVRRFSPFSTQVPH